jgi:hypothetical protein
MKDRSSNKIPIKLDETLSEISEEIPVCIVSSKEMIQSKKSQTSSSASKLYVEMYSTHPFIDIYGIKCDKGIAIGVHSDRRLHPRLDCQYNVDFDRLALFLGRLSHDNFEFSDKLLY